jgi:hypothetical protein
VRTGDELRNIIGTFAECVVAPETRIVPKPANLTFEQPQRQRRPESLRCRRSAKGTSNQG